MLLDLARRFLPKEFARNLAKAAGLVLAIQVAGAPISYGLQIVLARTLGTEDYGTYSYVMAWVFLLALPAGLGFTTALVRLLPEYDREGRDSLMRGAALRSWHLVPAAGIVIALVAFGLLTALGGRVPLEQRAALSIGLWIVPAYAMLQVQVGMARGLRRMVLAYLPMRVLYPALIIGGIGGADLIVGDLTIEQALWISLVAIVLVSLGQAAPLWRTLREKTQGVSPEYRTTEWMRISLPMLFIAGFFLLLDRTDVLMLGMLAGSRDVGTYHAASRTATMAAFILTAVNAIAGPTIASVHAEGDEGRLQRLASVVAHLAFWPSTVLVVLMVLLAPTIMGFFGADFIEGTNVLIILAIIQLVNVAAGSVGYFMNMTGNHVAMARIVGVVALLNLILNWLAIPRYGATGAAVATGTSMIIWNAWLYQEVVERLSVRPSIFHAVGRLWG